MELSDREVREMHYFGDRAFQGFCESGASQKARQIYPRVLPPLEMLEEGQRYNLDGVLVEVQGSISTGGLRFVVISSTAKGLICNWSNPTYIAVNVWASNICPEKLVGEGLVLWKRLQSATRR